MFQISSLDKITLIKQPIRRNKYRNLLLLLFTFISLILGSSTLFSSQKITGITKIIYHYEYFSYATAILCSALETLFVAEITTQLTKKFSKLNANIHTRKVVTLMQIHNHLSATSRKINNVFGFPALIITGVNFYFVTTTLYYTLQLALLPPTMAGTLQLLASTTWSVVILTEVFILGKCFENVTEKVS